MSLYMYYISYYVRFVQRQRRGSLQHDSRDSREVNPRTKSRGNNRKCVAAELLTCVGQRRLRHWAAQWYSWRNAPGAGTQAKPPAGASCPKGCGGWPENPCQSLRGRLQSGVSHGQGSRPEGPVAGAAATPTSRGAAAAFFGCCVTRGVTKSPRAGAGPGWRDRK